VHDIYIYIIYYSVRISSLLLPYEIRTSCVMDSTLYYIILWFYDGATLYTRFVCRNKRISYHIIIWTRPVDSIATCYDGAPPIVKQMVFIYRRSPPCNILRPVTVYYTRAHNICILFGDWQQIFGWNIVYHASIHPSIISLLLLYYYVCAARRQNCKILLEIDQICIYFFFRVASIPEPL